MSFDRPLGRPIRALCALAAALLPLALIGLLAARFLPVHYRNWVWGTSFVILAGSIVLFTPYLMLAELCFYAMAQRPFPKSLAVDAWLTHALLLFAAAFCFWRTWILWPENLERQKPLPPDAVAAPWWGYVLGGIAVTGLFGVMAYFFHFRE